MQQVALLVRLKIPDVTALTARNALQRRMGYHDVLRDLRREDYYEFEVDTDSLEAARDLITKLAEQTNFFVNPNKHAFSVVAADEGPSRGNGLQTVRLLVTDRDDDWGSGMVATLQARGATEVVGAARGVLWTMQLAADSPEAARRVAEEIGITRRIDQGLLLNPHFQEGRLL
jgi:phosphoribosylformylglycinamidine (FGAM) synthase PurS component